MKNKILIISILIVLTLVTVSFTSTVSSNVSTSTIKKESPLYKIRTNRAIKDRIKDIVENIKTRFLENRVFIIPLLMEKIKNIYETEILWSAPAGTAFCCTVHGTPTSLMCCK